MYLKMGTGFLFELRGWMLWFGNKCFEAGVVEGIVQWMGLRVLRA